MGNDIVDLMKKTAKYLTEPSPYMILLFIAVIIYLFKNGYFKGALVQIKKVLLENKKMFTIWSGIAIMVVFFADKEVALFFKELHDKKLFLFEMLSVVGNTLGNGGFIYSVLIVAALFAMMFNCKKEHFFTILASPVLAGIINTILKILVSRERPFVGFDNTGFFELVKALKKGELWSFPYMSMPSGHTAIIASVAAIVILMMKRNRAVFILAIIPFVTAFDRIYRSEHWLSDVIIGGLVGYLSAYTVYRILCEKKKRGDIK